MFYLFIYFGCFFSMNLALKSAADWTITLLCFYQLPSTLYSFKRKGWLDTVSLREILLSRVCEREKSWGKKKTYGADTYTYPGTPKLESIGFLKYEKDWC